MSPVWGGEQEDLPGKEASQAEGGAPAKALRLKLGRPVGGADWRSVWPGRTAGDKAGLG